MSVNTKVRTRYYSIAPALVEFVSASNAVDDIDDSAFTFAEIVSAQTAANQARETLRTAMKEAGVTCE